MAPSGQIATSRRNAVAIAANGLFFPAAGKVLGAGLLLTWFASELTSSKTILSAIVPIQYGLSLVFQPWFAQWLGQRGGAVNAYRWQAILRGAVWVGLALLTFRLGAASPVLLLVSFFTVILIDAIAAGLGNIAFSDALALAVPPGRRGRIRGWRGASGAVTAGLAGWLISRLFDRDTDVALFGWPFLIAGLLYAAGGIVFAQIDAPSHESREAKASYSLWAAMARVLSNKAFRRLLLVEVLLIPLMQGLTYVALLGKTTFGIETKDLGILIAADAMAPFLGNIMWGRVADHFGNRLAISCAALVGAVAPVAAMYVMLGNFPVSSRSTVHAFALIIFVSGIGVAGVDLASKNQVLELSLDEAERPMYVGVNDTFVGLPTIFLIAAGVVVDVYGFGVIFAGMFILTISAAIFAINLPKPKSS